MKWIIASDLHGSAAWCRRLLDAFQDEQAERLLLLGDLLYHGPRNPFPDDYDTPAVTAMLNSVSDRLLCVRGNCDSEVDQMVLSFPMMAEYAFLSVDGLNIFAAHGHNYGPENPPPLKKGDYLLCGHFHLPICEDRGTYTYLNPGSLAPPKDGTPHSYIVVENGALTWKDLAAGVPFEPMK